MDKTRDCRDCGEEILPARLKIKPNTYLCTDCQNLSEKKGNFVRHKMEIVQELEGWEFAGQELVLIKGSEE
jgi:RNA polymerase-binding transcription factor DksA